MLVAAIKHAFPALLLAASLVRVSGLSVGYAALFVASQLWPPLSEGGRGTGGGWDRSARGWRTSPLFWIGATLYALFACLAHAAVQVLLGAGTLQDSPRLRAAGFHTLDGTADALRSVGPDVLMLLVGIVCTIVVLRLARRERVGAPSADTFALRVATFLLLFCAGIASPSLVHGLYFYGFTAYLCAWAVMPGRLGRGLPAVPPAAAYVVAAHVLLTYLYQFEFLSGPLGAKNAARLGFFAFGGWSRRQVAHYVAFAAEVCLLAALGSFAEKRREVALAQSMDAAAELLAAKERRAAPPAPRGRVNGGGDDDEDGDDDGGGDDTDAGERLRRVLDRGVRAHGRKVVLLSVFGLALTEPSWLGLALLALFFVAAVVPRRRFDVMAVPLMAYLAFSVGAQYLWAVPSLLPTGPRLERAGLSRHAPAPALYLLVAYTPLLLVAGYARMVRASRAALTAAGLEYAAATGDTSVVQRAADERSPLVRPELLHVAARHGHADAVRALLGAGLDASAQDAAGNTPLHAAYREGYNDVCDVLLREGGARAGVTNAAGRRYSEVPRSAGARAWAAVRQGYRYAENLFFRHADKVSLAVLYLVGMHRLNWLHLGYIVFFLVFFSVPYLARRAWAALVLYSAGVLSLLYAWAVFLADGTHKQEDYPWAGRVGLFRATNLWRDLLMYYLVALFVAAQMHVYRSLAASDDLLARQARQLRAGRLFEFRALNQLFAFLGHLYSASGLFLAYATLVLVSLGGHASLIKCGYLALFLLALAVHQYASAPHRTLRSYWVAVVTYTALALLAQYAYQFPLVHDWVKEHYPASLASKLSLRDIGLRQIETTRWELIRNLFAPTAAFVMCVFELRVLWDGGDGGAGAASPAASPAASRRRGGYAALDGSDMEVGVHHGDDDDDDAGAGGDDDDDGPNWLLARFDELTAWLKAVMHEHSSKLTLIAVWLTVSTINSANLMNLAYLLVALAYINSTGRGAWVPLSVYGSLVLLARYAFQFPTLAKKASERTRWYGFDDYEAKLFRHLAGDVLIVCLAAVQAVALRQWAARGDAAVAVAPASSSSSASRKNAGKDDDVDDEEEGGAAEKPSGWRLWLAELGLFLLVLWARVRRLAGSFFSDYGLQVALSMLIMCAACRANVMSLLYVGVWVGLYLLAGPDRVAGGAWRALGGTLLVTLVFQYYVAMGPFPSGKHHYPWHGMDPRWQRWLMLGGFRTVELNWDFFTLLAVALQARHFSAQQAARRRLAVEMELGLQAGRGAADPALGGDDDDEDGGAPDPEVVRGDPGAWYNTVWAAAGRRVLVLFDKAVLLLVFYVSSLRPDLVSFGYVVMALRVLLRKDLYLGGGANFERHLGHWSRLALYNYGVLVLTMLYQVPLVRPSSFAAGTVPWEDVVGLGQYGGSTSQALASDGVVDSVVVFVLIDLQLLVFASRPYRGVLAYYEENRRQAAFRAVESTRVRKERRMQALSLILRKRRVFTSKLRHIARRLVAAVQDAGGDGADPFRDEEVWPQRWDDDDTRDSLDKADHSDDEVEELEQRIGVMDERALVAFSEEMEAEEAALPPGATVRQAEEAEAGLSWFARWTARANRTLRGFFARNIDQTLWMLITEDAATGIKYNTAAPLHTLTTAALAQRFVVSNTQSLVFFVYVINLLVNPSLVSLFVPTLVFAYAIFEEPRAPKAFWLMCLLYTTVMVCVKFLFQLDVFCVTAADHRYSLQPSPYCTSLVSGYTSDHEVAPDRVLGIHKTEPSEFFSYVAWDVMCVIAVVWHRAVMLSKGVWDLGEEDMGDPLASQRGAAAAAGGAGGRRGRRGGRGDDDGDYGDEEKGGGGGGGGGGGEPDANLLSRTGHWDEEPADDEKDPLTAPKRSVESALQWVWRLVPAPVRAYYRRLVPRDRRHVHLVKPGEDLYMWIFLIELVCAVYILLFYALMATTAQSSVTSSLSTNLFSGSMVLTLLAQIALIILDRICYLYRSLRWKIVLQYFTVGLWSGLAFFRWPQTAQLAVQENPYVQVFFFLKTLYFLASGLQIKWGFPTVEQTGFQYITRRPSVARGYVFRTYRALPFVFELRSLLDWMTHETSLDLWEALKLEDIYASMFLVQCDILYRKQYRRGEVQPGYVKFLNGTLVFLLLIVIIFAPLLIFSSANPVTTANNVQATHVALSLVGPQGEYHLAGVSSMNSISRVSNTQYGLMKQDRVIADDSQGNIQSIAMVTFADDYWTISQPSREQLERSLKEHQLQAKFRYQFTRPGPAGAKTISDSRTVPLTRAQQEAVAAMIGGGGAGAFVELPQLVPKYLRLPALGSPIVLTDQMLDAYLSTHADGGSPYFSLSGDEAGTEGVKLVTINNPVFQNPFGFNTFTYSVIGLYSIVLLTVGRFVRLFFANLMVNIPYEDLHDVTDLVALCEAVYIARYARFHHKEEKLYRRLIKIFRSPGLLVAMTRRRDKAE